MNKKLLGIIIVLVLVAGGIFVYKSQDTTEENLYTQDSNSGPIENVNPNQGGVNTAPSPGVVCTMEAKQCSDGSYVGRTGPNCEFAACPAPTVKSYTLSEVASHNSASDCWTAINGSVYNVTSWIGKHPGGPDAIKSLCGKDGSAAFSGQHGSQPRPATELASFKIGVLK